MEFKNTEVFNFKKAILGMRNPKNSWDKSDSGICEGGDNGIGCSNCALQTKLFVNEQKVSHFLPKKTEL